MPESFLSLIVTMLPAFHEIEQRLDRETGRRFNAFNLFAMNELATTRILAFLLDPTEAHGQKDVFLRLFIERFVPEWKQVFKYRTAQKKSTTEANEAIDVTISDGSCWLGIENKIFDAQEQPQQAARYLNALQLRAGSHRERYRLVYLSPRGAPPTVDSLPKKEKDKHGANLVCGAWTRFDPDDEKAATPNATIMDWLTDCRDQCRAENVAWLIRQFAAYVESEIAGKKESDMVDAAIIGLALKEGNLEAALRIGENFDEIKRDVMSKLLRCVHDGLEGWVSQQGRDWEVVAKWKGGIWIEQPYTKWLPLSLRKRAWPARVGVDIIAEKIGPTGPWGVFIGISGPTKVTWKSHDTERYGELNTFIGEKSRERISEKIKMPKQSKWWVQYGGNLRDAEGHDISDWRDITTVARLHSQRDAVCKHIVEQMREIAAKIGDLVIDDT